MLVVADSSPLIALINTGHIDVLPRLFGQIIIPPEIAREIALPHRPQLVREFSAKPPDWLRQEPAANVELLPKLHPPECAAISLARQLNADLLLIDERFGREAAAARGLRFTGTVGVLEQAAEAGLLDLSDAFERLKRTDFWISHRLLDERLRFYTSKRKVEDQRHGLIGFDG